MKKNQPSMMDRTRAAVGYLNAKPKSDDGTELAAFMSIFHPEVPKDKVQSMMNDARDKQRRRR